MKQASAASAPLERELGTRDAQKRPLSDVRDKSALLEAYRAMIRWELEQWSSSKDR